MEVVCHVLVDLPVDACRLQPLRVGRPAIVVGWVGLEELVAVVCGGAAGQAERVVRACPVEQAIGAGARLHRAVIGIAQREGIGQRMLEGNVFRTEIAHRMVLLGTRPGAHAALVPGGLCVGPAVRRARHPHVGELLSRVQVERRDQALAIARGLMPDGPAAARTIADRNRKAIAKAAHAAHRSEVVIEAAVLLHQDHHMLHILQRPGAAAGLNAQGARNGGRQPADAGHCGALPQAAQESTAAWRAHVSSGRRRRRSACASSTGRR